MQKEFKKTTGITLTQEMKDMFEIMQNSEISQILMSIKKKNPEMKLKEVIRVAFKNHIELLNKLDNDKQADAFIGDLIFKTL